ncbi:MAG: MATE family efflux transporter [bacterium]|nr:MATE family efflux transporter [bacterium]
MNAKTKVMTQGEPMRLIFGFAAPMLLGNIFQQFYNIADSTIVGRFVGAEALAAVGATSTLQMLTLCLCFGLTNGAGVIVAQCIGAKSYEQLRKTLGSLICVVSVTVAVMLTLGIIFAPAALRFLSVPDEIIDLSAVYFKIIMAGAPFMMAYNTCSAVMRSMGNSKTPLFMLMISSGVNIALDLVFVVLLHLGVAGAAAATVISQAVSAAACIIWLVRSRFDLHLDGLKIRPDRESVVNILKTGLPAALQSSMIAIGNLGIQRLINSFGTMTVAAYAAAGKVDSIAIMVVVTMGMSLSVFCGQNAGAGRTDRIRSGLYKTLSFVLAYCLVLALIMMFFGRNLLSVFLDANEAEEALNIGEQYLKIIGVAYFMAGVMRCYLNVVHGTGDVNVSMATGLAELAVRIIASYILVIPFGLIGLWIAIPVSWGCGSIIPVVRYYSGKWKAKTLIHSN